MSKHIGAYSSLHGPAGKTLTDYTESNIPSLWSHAPERIEDIMNTGSQYTGFIPGWTPENPFILTEDKLFFFTPHVTSLANPRLSINGLPLAFLKEPDARTSNLAAGYFAPNNDYLIRWKAGIYEVLVNLTTLASDLRGDDDGGGGGEGSAELLDADTSIAAYEGTAAFLQTAGFKSYSDGGGKIWKRGSVSPPITTPALPAVFKRQSFDGHWYEAVSTRTIQGETLGILGEGTGVDVGVAINEAIAWLAGKGGGRLTLPPGVCYSGIDILNNNSGIWIEGTTTGVHVGSPAGTTLQLGANKTFHIGEAGGVERYAFKCSDLRVAQSPGSQTYFFSGHNLRNIRFKDIQINGIFGFLKAGDTINASDTRMIFMDNIEGNLFGSTLGEHFIRADNIGAFFLSNVVVEGGLGAGQSFIHQPYHPGFTQNKPDGSLIVNCGASLWDYGIRFLYGISNFYCTNTWLDRCGITALEINVRAGSGGIRFNNCHFVGYIDQTEEQVGIKLAETANTLFRVEISDSQIAHWGKSAIVVENTVNGLMIMNNQIEDCGGGGATTGLHPVIRLGGTDPGSLNLKCNYNQYYKNLTTGDFAKLPSNGIIIDTPHDRVEVIGNSMGNLEGAAIVNPHRGDPEFRKVFGNSGQILEGTTSALGPWCRTDVVHSLDGSTMGFNGAVPGGPNSGHIHIVATRRGRIMSTWLDVTGDEIFLPETDAITVQPTINGVAQAVAARVDAGETYKIFHALTGGLEFDEGDRLGMVLATATDLTPSTPAILDVTAGIIVYYD